MACGKPVVASPVGANNNIVNNGITGFLVEGNDEWLEAFNKLIRDIPLQKKMGEESQCLGASPA